MQLYALDSSGKLIFARHAFKQLDYFCPECHRAVRLRGGLHRQDHFYHAETGHGCRQNGKSLEHLHVQLYFLRTLPAGECALERRFESLKRIADVVWESQKIIFEVQCSPITLTEVQARNCDYQSLGYHVVWVLHDKQFNQKRVSAAECFLKCRPHYFTNIDAEGAGGIYDQFSLQQGAIRTFTSTPLVVDVQKPKLVDQEIAAFDKPVPEHVLLRLSASRLYFAGDLVDHSLNVYSDSHAVVESVLLAEYKARSLKPPKPASLSKLLKTIFFSVFTRPYKLFFQILLERACK